MFEAPFHNVFTIETFADTEYHSYYPHSHEQPPAGSCNIDRTGEEPAEVLGNGR